MSDAARRILLDAKDRDILLRQAALSPPIHKELWEHYGGFLPERDEDLKKYLLVEKNFNQQSVDGFIAQFRASIALTNLVQGDMLQEDKKEEKIISSSSIAVLWNSNTFPFTFRDFHSCCWTHG